LLVPTATIVQTITELAPLIACSRASAASLVERCLAQIAARDGELRAFITVLAEEASRNARQADEEIRGGRYRGPLHGIPISIKDLIDVRGVPTTAASRLRAGHVAPGDAPVVAHLREAGAIIIGKCNLHEFAYGTTSEDSAFGAVRNPHDLSRSAGGSSGGSAAAVVAGMSLGSVGTDTGGSIRIPSAACGTVGLKPGYGEVSCDGVVALSRSLDHVGPLAASVADAWLLYDALRGVPRAKAPAVEDRAPLGGLRLGVLRPYFLELLDHEVREQFEGALDRLQQAGVRVLATSVAHAALVPHVYLLVQLPESSAYHAATVEARPQGYSPAVRLRLEMGRYVLAEDYVRAARGRDVLRREVDEALAECDALVLPTLPIPAPPLGASSVPVGNTRGPVRGLMLRETQLFNLTGHPAVSIPCGATRAGLPCGLQMVGHRSGTHELLRVAFSCEPTVNPQAPRA
jgi:aspartyl-tRNA(Asn)/glutamyl-tRNA(Gln) amidotransferase subunit A